MFETRRPPDSTSPTLRSAACLLLLAVVAGCGSGNSVEEVVRLQDQGNFEASIEPLRRLLAEDPDDPRINYLYGRALTAGGEVSLAEWSLRKAAEDPEWLTRAGMQLAVGAMQAGNYDTVIEIASRVLEAEPENLDVMLIRANAYSRSRRHKELALAEANRILELDPGNSEAMEPKIVALLEMERTEEAREAIALLGEWIEEKDVGTELRGWHCATAALFADESGEHELAAERWTDCLQKYPGHPNVIQNAIEFYDARRDHARSLEVLEAAVEAEPLSIDYRKRLALRLGHAGRVDEAEKILIGSVETAHPALVPVTWIDLAKHYQDRGDQVAAARATERAIEASRELGNVPPQMLFEYADSLVLAGDFDRALAAADEMTVAPHQALIRARVAQERGQHREALEQFEEAFRLWPNNPWARYYAALSAESVGDFDAAIEGYRYSMRIDAGATDARVRLARLLTAQGDREEALHMLHLLESDYPLDLEGELLAVRLSAWMSQPKQVEKALDRFQALSPELSGRALASMAEGARDRAGPKEAVRLLRLYGGDGMTAQDPSNPVALRLLIRLAGEAGQLEDLEGAVRQNLSLQLQIGAAHEVLGLWLELRGAERDEVRAAYTRALELEPQNPGALSGLARLASQQDPEAALELFDRAAAAAPLDAEHKLEAARLLVAQGRAEEAAQRYASLLEEHPHEGKAAAEWAELQLTRGEASEQTAELANRAVLFGGGSPALDLLARVYRKLDDPERASEAEERARELRERQKPAA